MSTFIPDVNAHLHTPYSFSAFSSVRQALDMASQEGVQVVGINDFYSMDGYGEWNTECAERHLYPLFNIEFISLWQEAQRDGLRINDPNNPGRTYLSGKGLHFPTPLTGREAKMLADVRRESNFQVGSMCQRLNELLEERHVGIRLSYPRIVVNLTLGSIRERHLAKALRMAVEEKYTADDDRMNIYETICGKPLKSAPADVAGIENELRGNLLKAGGAAFVPEDPKAFLPIGDVKRIIEAAGGMPTYPFLADDAKGLFTDFEGDLQQCADTLKKMDIHSVEFISNRNTTAVLEQYAAYLEDEGFVVTFGSEHNTPAMEPVRLHTRDNAEELSNTLRSINFRGACRIAAHQRGSKSMQMGEELIMERINVPS